MSKKGSAIPSPEAGHLSPCQDACLKVSKEIVLKFIEVRSLNLVKFDEAFEKIYQAVTRTVENN